MKIHQHIITGAQFRSFIDKPHHLLVVPIHKIYFEPFYPHIGIMLHDIFHIPMESPISGPKNQTDIFPIGIRYQFRQIYFRNNLH